MPAGRPPKYKTPEEMQEIIDLYFFACKSREKLYAIKDYKPTEEEQAAMDVVDDIKPTVSGLAYTLGMATETLRDYGTQDEFSATVKKAKQKIERYLEQNLYGQAVTGTIFNLKNNFGWKDKVETAHSGEIGGAFKIIHE